MLIEIKSMREASLLDEASNIWYNGVVGDEVSFTIRNTEYRYKPDSSHENLQNWDKEIKSIIGRFDKTGAALNFVKSSSSSYRKVDSAEEKRECTTTADMSLELIDTTEYDKSHDDDRINDKPIYDKNGKVIRQ